MCIATDTEKTVALCDLIRGEDLTAIAAFLSGRKVRLYGLTSTEGDVVGCHEVTIESVKITRDQYVELVLDERLPECLPHLATNEMWLSRHIIEHAVHGLRDVANEQEFYEIPRLLSAYNPAGSVACKMVLLHG